MQTAYAVPTDIPGLVDVHGPDGMVYRDLTLRQAKGLAWQRNWLLAPRLQ